ncbi:MAG: 3-oxoacyl-ACP reductase FabG [Clostridia bacterium]|nr:3-oxoacyl-ACP reductase FabG [Clostridia bacterium]
MKLKDRVAIVTGGSRGIGKEIAHQFLKEGAKVIICATDEEKLLKTFSNFKGLYNDIDYCVVNIASKSDVDKMFDNVMGKYGRVDILVNNAGITMDAQLYKMTEEEWDRVIAVNLKGTFNCCNAAVKIMKENGYGKIINISSSSALDGNFGQVNYSAAKAGVIGMTKSMAKEVGKNNINVNVVVPGAIETEMIGTVPDKILETWKQRTPLKRLGSPEDVAKVCVFFASDDSGFITGEVIRVSGGFTL